MPYDLCTTSVPPLYDLCDFLLLVPGQVDVCCPFILTFTLRTGVRFRRLPLAQLFLPPPAHLLLVCVHLRNHHNQVMAQSLTNITRIIIETAVERCYKRTFWWQLGQYSGKTYKLVTRVLHKYGAMAKWSC